jgi:hydrogenase maturation protease
VEFGGDPGDIGFFNSGDLKDFQFMLSTHFLSTKSFINFMTRETGARFRILGIQPSVLEFGEQISAPVKVALEKVILMLVSLLQ